MALVVPLQWAQRKDNIYVTVTLRDFQQDKIIINEKNIEIAGKSDSKDYKQTFNLFKEIVPESSKTQVNGFSVQILLVKKDQESGYWPRLTEENKKFNNITVDWNKYIDEDEENEEAGKGLNDWDPEMMNNYQQGGQEDSDDDEQQPQMDDLDKDEEVNPEEKNE